VNEKNEESQLRNDEPTLSAFESLVIELLDRGNQAAYEAYTAGDLTADELEEIYRHLSGISEHGEQLLQRLH
jgi:hypothetical protein